MSRSNLRSHADRFLAIAKRHPECIGGRITQYTDESVWAQIDMNVEMPLHMNVDGISPNGVRRKETVTVVLRRSYPWSCPTFFLRQDFPRNLPHLLPASEDAPPRPCLIDGSPREYFNRFGLVDAGVIHLVHQLSQWLRRAAEGTLNDPEQGWEPTLRYGSSNFFVFDVDACRAAVDRKGGFRTQKANFFRTGPVEANLSNGASVWIESEGKTTPLKREVENLFTSRQTGNHCLGNTVLCLIWPDKLSDGRPHISDRHMPETVNTLSQLRRRAGELGCLRSLETFLRALHLWFKLRSLKHPVPIAITMCVPST